MRTIIALPASTSRRASQWVDDVGGQLSIRFSDPTIASTRAQLGLQPLAISSSEPSVASSNSSSIASLASAGISTFARRGS